MPSRFKALLIALLLSSVLASAPARAEVDWDQILIDVDISPEPEYSQMAPGETFEIVVTVLNQGPSVSQGEAVSPSDPSLKYSGRLVVEVVFESGRTGSYIQGDDLEHYEATVESSLESRKVNIPRSGSARTISYTRTIEGGYDEASIPLDEWLTFSIVAKTYVELYTDFMGERQYILGWLIEEAEATFYVLDEAKAEYVEDTVSSLRREVDWAAETVTALEEDFGWDIGFDHAPLSDLVSSMEASFAVGDYVSAMEAYSGLDPAWRQALVDSLASKLSSLESIERQLSEVLSEYEALQAESQALSEQLANVTETLIESQEEHEERVSSLTEDVDALEARVSSLRFYNQVYLFGLLAIGGTVVIVLFKTGAIEIVIEEEGDEEEEAGEDEPPGDEGPLLP
jgi:regulator of replication initiation timing